jgi:hypothetical protein
MRLTGKNPYSNGTLGSFAATTRHFRQTAAPVPALQVPQMAFLAEVRARQADYRGPFTATHPVVHGMALPVRLFGGKQITKKEWKGRCGGFKAPVRPQDSCDRFVNSVALPSSFHVFRKTSLCALCL